MQRLARAGGDLAAGRSGRNMGAGCGGNCKGRATRWAGWNPGTVATIGIRLEDTQAQQAYDYGRSMVLAPDLANEAGSIERTERTAATLLAMLHTFQGLLGDEPDTERLTVCEAYRAWLDQHIALQG